MAQSNYGFRCEEEDHSAIKRYVEGHGETAAEGASATVLFGIRFETVAAPDGYKNPAD